MGHITPESKEAIVLQAINRGRNSIESIAKKNHVGQSSLQRWLGHYRAGKPLTLKSTYGGEKSQLSGKEQLHHILSTAELDEVSLGQYCREHGLYSHQIQQWRENFMHSQDSKQSNQHQTELRKLQAENKGLQRELRRKDKALAEASALLILKKKADLIWGVGEDD